MPETILNLDDSDAKILSEKIIDQISPQNPTAINPGDFFSAPNNSSQPMGNDPLVIPGIPSTQKVPTPVNSAVIPPPPQAPPLISTPNTVTPIETNNLSPSQNNLDQSNGVSNNSVTPAPIAPIESIPLTVKKSPLRIFKLVGIIIVAIIIFGAGGATAAYRFVPSAFYKVVPYGLTSKINVLWPLHHDFSEMVPEDSLMYLNVNVEGDQLPKLTTLLNRIPGYKLSSDVENQLNKYLQQNLNITFDKDFEAAFENKIGVAVVNSENNVYAGVKIKDYNKAKEMLTKINASSEKSHISLVKYNGQEVYIIQPPKVNLPINSKILQTLNTLFIKSNTAVATTTKSCTPKWYQACADSSAGSQPLTNSTDYPAITALDNYLVVSDTYTGMQKFIDQNLHKNKNLTDNGNFSGSQSSSQPLLSLYINLKKELESLNQNGRQLYKGYNAWNGSVSAIDKGVVLNSNLNYDPKAIDTNLAKVFAAPSHKSSLAKTVPSSVAFYFEGSELGSELKSIAAMEIGDKQTVDDSVNQILGIKLSSAAEQLKNSYSISYHPSAKSALVFQGEINNANATLKLVDQIKTYIKPLANLDEKTENIAGNNVTVLTPKYFSSLGSPNQAAVYADCLSPSYTIKNNMLIISSNPSGITELTTAPSSTLADDKQWQDDQTTIGSEGRVMSYLNTKRFYNGVVGTIRAITNNPDLSVSDQEKVIAAMLDAFPSISGVEKTENSKNIASSIIPIKELDAAKKADIEQTIKKNPGAIFDLSPFLEPLGLSSAATPAIQTNDATRKSDVTLLSTAIANQIKYGGSPDQFMTHGAEKIDPSGAVIQSLITSGNINKAITDPEWPNYYYTLESDGSIVKVSALTEQKYDDNNCQPAQQVRGRWTYCAEESVLSTP